MAGIVMQSDLESYVTDANEVILFNMIRDVKDIEREDNGFAPEYTHQIFGEGESIFGYLGLKIDMFYSASRLIPFFRVSYDEIISPSKTGGVEADNVLKIISDKLETSFQTNLDDFTAGLQKESSFKPYGKLIHSFEVSDEKNNKKTYQVFQANMLVSGFKEYHHYMQSFILWFIDAASYIDVDDERWEYFVLYERVVENGTPLYYFIGFTTVYRYYAYPNNLRPRISQMMILPPYQKRGLGAEMLQAINKWYIQDSDVIDITVEDPSDNFIRIRDYVDSKNCLKLMSFQKSNLSGEFKEEMWKEAQEKFKICKRQSRRIYEILRLRSLNKADMKQYKAFRLSVKKRLNAPHQRQKMDLEKLRKSLTPDEYTTMLNCMSKDQRIEQLDRSYKELESEYQHIIKRLSMSSE